LKQASDIEVAADRTVSRLENRQISAGILDDGKLVEDCLSQNPAAWSQLYEACHAPLVSAICSVLRNATTDDNVVDEIAARVWYALVRDQAQLLSRFDVTRGCRLNTFLSAIAKNEARQFFRSERRRRHREKIASRSELEPSSQFTDAFATDHNFLNTLTPGERGYYESVLMNNGHGETEGRYSAENSWQLRHRLRKKLIRYLESE
jgi:DNA-directed RNA polymerase specialized sigma24 family protein